MKTAIWVTVCVLAGSSIQLHAQNALGNGRGLDNNLQVGGGRTNPAALQHNYRIGNNIVTGDVGGLSRFHGRVGYGSPGEFRGNLPSNSLFRFQARSIQTQGGYNLTPTTVYRSGAAVTASDIANRAGNQLIIPRTIDTMSPYKTFMPSQTLNNTTSAIGSTRQADGSKLQIGAIQGTGGKTSGDLRPRVLDLGSPIGGDASVARDNMSLIGVTDSQLDEDRLSTSDPLALAAENNTNVDIRVKTPGMGKTANQSDHQLRSLKERIDQHNTAPSETAADQNVYNQILDRVAKNQQTPNPSGDSMMRSLVPTTKDQKSDDPMNLNPFMPQLQTDHEPSKAASVVDLQRQLQSQRQLIRDFQSVEAPQAEVVIQKPVAPSAPAGTTDLWLLPKHLKPSAPQAPAAQTPFTQIKAETQQTSQFDKLVTAVDYNLPLIGSLASANDTQADRLLHEAEAQLANQRYFDADDSYLSVLRLRPNDPMAAIGQIHAQIGVGMIRTASYKLHRLLLKHPELISARYDKKLLPAAQRLRWVQEELRELTTQSKSVQPPLLLAYLGYQLDNPKPIRSALDTAVARKPNDPVVLLLRRIWLRNTDQPTKQ